MDKNNNEVVSARKPAFPRYFAIAVLLAFVVIFLWYVVADDKDVILYGILGGFIEALPTIVVSSLGGWFGAKKIFKSRSVNSWVIDGSAFAITVGLYLLLAGYFY
jgi:fatty-acid desaturase